jgi:hypothetical protein
MVWCLLMDLLYLSFFKSITNAANRTGVWYPGGLAYAGYYLSFAVAILIIN